jgi:hypothetical protein
LLQEEVRNTFLFGSGTTEEDEVHENAGQHQKVVWSFMEEDDEYRPQVVGMEEKP